MLSDNEAHHHFHLKADPETERLVARLQGQEEHMQADTSVVTGTGFSRDTFNLPEILGTRLINCGWVGTLCNLELSVPFY